jgi:isoquinoline 1-oxidoreductase beta subunit
MNAHRSELALNRRRLLQSGAGAGIGLLIGFHLPAAAAATPNGEASVFAPNAFIRITSDNVVTLISKHVEFGQRIHTGLATIVAEELDAEWSQMRVESAPSDETLYANAMIRNQQHTGGSTSIANSWTQLRTAAANARAMLVAAAAKTWRVPAEDIVVDKGLLTHSASKRSGTFGSFAAQAAKLPKPVNVALKDPRDFKLIGQHVHGIGVPAIVAGKMKYPSDFHEPGMRVAVVRHSPRFGGTVKSFDARAAKAIPGVYDVVQIPTGVAVVADSFWTAKRGRDVLNVTWDDSNAERRSTSEIFSEYRPLAGQPGKSALKEPRGDAEKALGSAAKHLRATFEVPYLTHAPMEPLAITCRMTKDSCDVWTGSRSLTTDHINAATISGLPRDKVRIHSLNAGGAFGRHGPSDAAFKSEAVVIAKALGADGVPVKVLWTREDDIHSGMYRPMVHHAMEAGLDAAGNLVAWRHRIVGQTMLKSGAADLPYAIPNFAVETHEPKSAVTNSPLRSVDHTHTAFATEVFIDELAVAAGKDAVEFRRPMMVEDPRLLATLNVVAEKAGWGQKLAAGKGRGIATHFTMGSRASHVVDVAVDAEGRIKVERVVCAVDCGIAINPDVIRAQIEGGIIFALSNTLHEAITLKNGLVEQSNFNDYRILRMAEVPQIEVHIIPSREAPTGVGELGVPPVAPAVVNAIFAATGRRLRNLPLGSERPTV